MAVSLPQWLNTARSTTKLNNLVETLEGRERLRAKGRSVSRGGRSHGSGPHNDFYAVSVGSSQENLTKNRYHAVEPYDRTRVVVPPDNRYINASWVRECDGGSWWIAAQAALPRTAHDFLSLLALPVPLPQTAQNSSSPSNISVRTIVQLTPNVEGQMRKADPYFPETVGMKWSIPPPEGSEEGPVIVRTIAAEQIQESSCRHSTLQIQLGSHEPVTVHHYRYEGWPDHDVPSDLPSLISFARLVDRSNRSNEDPTLDPPILVGCSAGIGRTGTYIAICSLLRSHGFLSVPSYPLPIPPPPPSPLGPLPDSVADDKIAQEIDWLREQRGGMVQGSGQIQLVYRVLLDAFMASQ